MRTQGSKAGSSGRQRSSGSKHSDGVASRSSKAKSFKGRFSSVGSMQSAMNLKRKEAFDDETHMMEDTTVDGNVTFVTSTTDYLREAGRDAKSRNLDASFDSEDTPASKERKDPTPTIGTMSLFSQNSSHEGKIHMSSRERKRLKEREWERDRQRRTTAEPRKPLQFSGRLRGYDASNFQSTSYDFDEEFNSICESNQAPRQPQSSRQLWSGVDAPPGGRDGYDSDSYSIKLNKARLRTARPSRRDYYEAEDSRPSRRDHYEDEDFRERQPTTISNLLTDGVAKGGSEEEEGTMEGTMNESTADFGGKADQSQDDSFLVESATKIKMTKMEKIKQLQSKNERYKEEYKKTYLEKKEFKKKYEDKKMEVASLTMEIESYMKETALLKKQLSQLTNEIDNAEGSTRKDMAMVAKLQKELKQTRADLKEALGRIADRKIQSSELKEITKRKDEQIQSLTLEVSQQIEEVQKLQAQLSVQDMGSTASSQIARDGTVSPNNNQIITELKEENKNMKDELSMTLNRAAEMVKNRESTIEILRKENHELKELMDIRDQDDDRTTTSEKIQRRETTIEQLQTEIAGLKETLEESAEEKEQLKDVIRSREAELKNVKLDVEGLKRMVKRAEKDAHLARTGVDNRDGKMLELHDDIRKLQTEVKDSDRQIKELNGVIGERDMEIRELMNEIENLKVNHNGSSLELGRFKTILDEKEQEVKDLYRETENLKAEMLQQRNQMDDRRKRVVLELEELKLREKDLQEEVQDSAAMVQQREEAIEDLLKEVENLKKGNEDKESHLSAELSKQEQTVRSMMKDMDRLKRSLSLKGQELEQSQAMVKEREVAIEDLLTEIEDLKLEGKGVDKKIAERAEKMQRDFDDQNEEIEKLRTEVDDTTTKLNEAQYDLQTKEEVLREREESIEELLQDMNELKKQFEEQMQHREEEAEDDQIRDALQCELETARDLVKEKEESLRRVLQESEKLKEKWITVKIEKEALEKEVKEAREAKEAKEAEENNKDNDDNDDESEEGDTKSYLVAQHEVLEEEIQQLNDQVGELQASLEDVHRQNSILNEEVEDWVQRGGIFELEIERLRNEVEAWQDKAEQLESAGGMQPGGGDQDNAEGGDQQAMMLEKALAERQRKNGGDGKGVWGLFFNKSEEDEDLTEDQKRIKELEGIKDAQAEELQKIKSDLVKLTTTSRNESYVAKKRISDLEEENVGYKAKVDLLLRRLAEAQGVPCEVELGEEKKVDDASSIFPRNIL
ncbi:oligomeric mucus gel-forming [Seminavis robusta]|uniref:Oligomeric mucus gel-forming n=1 Tax=Seminavis robusta TaxID=568900 RepID=A0A9N8HQ39_9STRA|nr:oligomeric mucus gel-forming [Seminavis robusta]|eukprot:Sro1131_g244600.1 oligomeric mucus gel-forming (1250) ;mRNA; f:4406-8155